MTKRESVMAGIPSAQHQGMPAVNPRNFIPPEPRAKPSPVMESLPLVSIQDVFRSVPTANDQSTALDRARGVVIMEMPFIVASMVLGFMAMLLLHWMRHSLWFEPRWPAYTFVFLLCVFGGIIATHRELVQLSYEHSPTGVEHHRLDVAESVYTKTLDAELEVRIAMLQQTLDRVQNDRLPARSTATESSDNRQRERQPAR